MNYQNNTYIYETPDNGKTIYKRKFMNYEDKTIIKQMSIRNSNVKKQTTLDNNLFDNFLSYLQKK